MATVAPTVLSIEEYLRTSDYEPDAEFVDDHIEERSKGEFDHSDLQSELAVMLRSPQNRSYFKTCVELRVRVALKRVRIPDVCLIARSAPKEQVLLTPPLLCIEVLSPEDRMSRVMVRVRDFLRMGVPEVWIFDTESRTVQVCTVGGTESHSTGDLPIPGTPVTLSLAEIFRTLDE